MCGIAGIVHFSGQKVNKDIIVKMNRVGAHRGPDDEGFLVADTQKDLFSACCGRDSTEEISVSYPSIESVPEGNLAFGFRRLSILDLSAAGHQPMHSEDGKYWIVFNGEVYNYIEIRERLIGAGYRFKSGTDTEVVLAAFRHYGEACVLQFNGMWAFAIWDQNNQKLFCSRDRFGIKPFYYYYNNHSFYFASEIKQLVLPEISRTINFDNVFRAMENPANTVYPGMTFFNEILILNQSCNLTVTSGGIKTERYYDLDISSFGTFKYTFAEASEIYRNLFEDSVRLQLRSDVPVGVSLSGGQDSSAIACTAARFSPNRLHSFTAYYPEKPIYDERSWATIAADSANMIASFVSPEPDAVIRDIQNITWNQEYPVNTSSFLTHYYVAGLAKQTGVPVLLEGQGSDEIAAGYNHTFYRYYADLIRSGKISGIKDFVFYLFNGTKGSAMRKFALTLLVSMRKESALYEFEAHKMRNDMLAVQPEKSSRWGMPVVDLNTDKTSNFLYNLLYSTSLPSLLNYGDKNAMAHGIESRMPFLDHRLVEFVFTLPSEYKLKGSMGKLVHREALRPIVPKAIVERKDKNGFSCPGERVWMRNQLRDFTGDIFSSASFGDRGIFNLPLVRKNFDNYLAGSDKYATNLWQIMALELWFRAYTD